MPDAGTLQVNGRQRGMISSKAARDEAVHNNLAVQWPTIGAPA